MIRIGHGYDVHPFAPRRPLVLGGVTVPHRLGLGGHSDADVLIHAVCDACLGAAALGDIGGLFPDTDAAYRNMDSRVFLERVRELLAETAWRVGNVDVTIIAEEPKVRPYVDEMRRNLAGDLGVAVERINIKATTTEHLGFIGREEGIAAHAVVLIEKDELDTRDP